MELDDLKQAWQQQTPENIDVRNDKNIIDMIQNKNYGPLASLKKQYLKSFYFFAFFGTFFLYYFFMECQFAWYRPDLITNKTFLLFLLEVCLPLCFGIMILQAIKSRKLINKIQNTESLPLKTEIQSKITDLEKGYHLESWMVITMIGIFFLLQETIMQNPRRDWPVWHNVSVYWRILVYIVILVIGYFINKYNYYKHFGKHINYLKEMLRQME